MIADASRTPIEYSPTSRGPESFTRKKRSLKLSAQRKSAEGTSGIPNRVTSRTPPSGPGLPPAVGQEPDVDEQRSGEVADDHADRPDFPHDDEKQGRADG